MPSTSSQTMPNSIPPTTSLSQCAPRYSRAKPSSATTTPLTQVRPHPLPPRHLARDQHREEAEGDRGHRHRDRREAETLRRGRRIGHVDGRAERRRQCQAEGQRRQPVRGGDPASSPQQPRQRQRRRRREHHRVADRGQSRHQPVGQRIAQRQHRLVHGEVQRHRLAVHQHRAEQRRTTPRRCRAGRRRGSAAMRIPAGSDRSSPRRSGPGADARGSSAARAPAANRRGARTSDRCTAPRAHISTSAIASPPSASASRLATAATAS